MAIDDLSTHENPFVTIGELADYWCVSRKQIYRLIDSGKLTAMRFGPRLFRVPSAEARKLEGALRVVSLGETRAGRRGSPRATRNTAARSPWRVV